MLRQTYELKGGETILFHAAAGGVGSLACQWAKALGVKLIGTVSSAQKAALAKANGAWATIDYSHEVAQRVLELTDGKKVPVVYDGVGKDTWLTSLDSVAPRGLVVSFGNASGAVDGVNLGILAAKGSLYVTRPTLATYANNAENLQRMADELFEMIISGKLTVDISQRYPLAERRRHRPSCRRDARPGRLFCCLKIFSGRPHRWQASSTGFGGEYKYCGHPKSLWELVANDDANVNPRA
jgi:NADPH2:quinone reductase